MKLEEGMIVRSIQDIGKHKKGTLYKIKETLGNLAFAVDLENRERVVLYRYSNLVEIVEREYFYV